jgi:hypothetical protein
MYCGVTQWHSGPAWLITPLQCTALRGEMVWSTYFQFTYRKVASSRPVYYSILELFGQSLLKIWKRATNRDRLLFATIWYLVVTNLLPKADPQWPSGQRCHYLAKLSSHVTVGVQNLSLPKLIIYYYSENFNFVAY